MPRDALQLSSAAHRSAALAQQSEALYFAVLCHAACFAVLFTSSYYNPIEVSHHVPVLLILHQVCTCAVVIGSQTMHPQLSSARLYKAQQHSAAQCGAEPCPSFCGSVSCGAVRSFEHMAAVTGSTCSTRYDTDTRFMYVFCVLVFLLSSVNCPLSVPMPPPPARKYHTYCHLERDTNQHIAQRRAISSTQAPLGIVINCLFAPNSHGSLLPAPFIYMFHLVAFFLART